MGIFGRAFVRQSSNESEGQYDIKILRERNDRDVFLNYFFALLFIFCILIGVTLNPLIVFYHSKQKKSFTNVLFLLISFIDQINSLYFPLFFIPKLLSSTDTDYYYCVFEVSSIPWNSYVNHILIALIGMEKYFLTVLCVARYLTIRHPLASNKRRNATFSSVLAVYSIFSVAFTSLSYLYGQLCYFKMFSFAYSIEVKFSDTSLILTYFGHGLLCLTLLVAATVSGLTIVHLKNSDTGASEASARNIRKGVVAIVAMNVFNVFVMLSAVFFTIGLQSIAKGSTYSTMNDFMIFTNTYGIYLAQSAFNSICFPIISTSFKAFVRKLTLPTRRVNPWSEQAKQ